MALVESDRTCEKEAIHMIRGALIDEVSATDLYDKMMELVPQKYRPILEEIKRDEINHQGRLMNILMEMQPGQLEPFNKGLEQQE